MNLASASCRSCGGGGGGVVAWDLGMPFQLGICVVRDGGGSLRRLGSRIRMDGQTPMAEHYHKLIGCDGIGQHFSSTKHRRVWDLAFDRCHLTNRFLIMERVSASYFFTKEGSLHNYYKRNKEQLLNHSL